MQQLRAVLKLLEDNEERITTALAKDLGKSAHEGYVTEVKFPLGLKDSSIFGSQFAEDK
jgi:hypothetical protein